MTGNTLRLRPVKLGFAFGLIWGLGWFLVGLAGWLFGYGMLMIHVMSSIYLGYAPTLIGSIVGGVLGFVDAFIFAWLVALVYNCCCGVCSNKSASE